MKKIINTLFLSLLVCILFGICDVNAQEVNKNIKGIKIYTQVHPSIYCVNGIEEYGCADVDLSSDFKLNKGDIVTYEVGAGQTYNFNVLSVDEKTNKVDMVMTLNDMVKFNKKTVGIYLVSSNYTKGWNVNDLEIHKFVQEANSLQFNKTTTNTSGNSRLLYPDEFDINHSKMFLPANEYAYWIEAFSSSNVRFYYNGNGEIIREDNMDVTEYGHYIRPVINIDLYEKSSSDVTNNNNNNNDKDKNENDVQKNEYDKIPDEIYGDGNNKISSNDVIIKENGQVVTKDGKNVYDKNGKLVYLKDGQQVKVDDTLKMAYIGYVIGIVVLILGIMVLVQTFRKKEEIY